MHWRELTKNAESSSYLYTIYEILFLMCARATLVWISWYLYMRYTRQISFHAEAGTFFPVAYAHQVNIIHFIGIYWNFNTTCASPAALSHRCKQPYIWCIRNVHLRYTRHTYNRQSIKICAKKNLWQCSRNALFDTSSMNLRSSTYIYQYHIHTYW